jgi:hypothetical protein
MCEMGEARRRAEQQSLIKADESDEYGERRFE